jgi:DNA-binding NarL/FixJ family response regulator
MLQIPAHASPLQPILPKSTITRISLMRIILADSHAQPCLALKVMLEARPEFDLLGVADDAQGLLKLIAKRFADLVLVDRELPGLFIADLITSLHALEGRPIVIVMSSDVESGRMLLKSGADAFVSKGEPDWLMENLLSYSERVKKKGGPG